MKKPSRIVRGPEVVKITDCTSDGQEENSTCDGEFSSAKGEIYVRGDAPPLQWLYILGHEWTHHILAWSGLSQTLESDVEEALCDAFGRALVDFPIENEHLIRYIYEVRDGKTDDES